VTLLRVLTCALLASILLRPEQPFEYRLQAFNAEYLDFVSTYCGWDLRADPPPSECEPNRGRLDLRKLERAARAADKLFGGCQ
jgi:hypothetical protein